VTLNFTDWGLILAIVASGCAVCYLLLLRKLRQSVLDRQREMERRVSMLAEVIRSLERRFGAENEFAVAPDANPELTPASARPADHQTTSEIPVPIQAAIAAAAVAVLGPNARVVSARPVPPREEVSPWSRQGRVSVHASHNVRSRR
jgi:hypothetical protein